MIASGEHGLRAVVKRLRAWTLFTSLWSTIVGAKGLPGPFILDKGKPVERPGAKPRAVTDAHPCGSQAAERMLRRFSRRTRHASIEPGSSRGYAGQRQFARAGAAGDETQPILSYRRVAGRLVAVGSLPYLEEL